MSGVSMYRMVGVGDREGNWWLPAEVIHASQGTFSSFIYTCFINKLEYVFMKHYAPNWYLTFKM